MPDLDPTAKVSRYQGSPLTSSSTYFLELLGSLFTWVVSGMLRWTAEAMFGPTDPEPACSWQTPFRQTNHSEPVG